MKVIETEFSNEINSCEYNLWDKEETQEHITNSVKIADKHAINFADWIRNSGNLIILHKSSLQTKELLEIYKEETEL